MAQGDGARPRDSSANCRADGSRRAAAMAACFGLPREAALRAITLDAAQIPGVSNRLGSLEAGKDATLILTSGDPLEITSQVRLAWIEGAPVYLSNKQLKLYQCYRARPREQ